MDTFNVAIEALKNERSKMLATIAKLREQVSCLHPEEERTIRKDAGYDIDESGSERQHIETCNKCGAHRIHFEHSVHGEDVSLWMSGE